jgi:hypothetical protein
VAQTKKIQGKRFRLKCRKEHLGSTPLVSAETGAPSASNSFSTTLTWAPRATSEAEGRMILSNFHAGAPGLSCSVLTVTSANASDETTANEQATIDKTLFMTSLH